MNSINKQLNEINQVISGRKISLDGVTRSHVDSCVKPITDMSFKASAIATPHLKTFLEIVNDENLASPKEKRLIKEITVEVKYFLDQFSAFKTQYRKLDQLIDDHFEKSSPSIDS